MARLDGIPGKEWPPEMLDALTALRPPPEHAPDAAERKRATSHPALEAFAIHPDLAKAFFTYNRHVLWGTTLPHRWRHILILRVAARRRAGFVWGEHVTQARDAGLDDEEIAAVGRLETPFEDAVEVALVQAVDELLDDGAIAAGTWQTLAGTLAPPQLVDVVFTAGCYNTVAWFTRSIELEVDADHPDQLPAGGPA